MNYYEPSYEDAILSAHESEADFCRDCMYKGTACRNQCIQIYVLHNPNLK